MEKYNYGKEKIVNDESEKKKTQSRNIKLCKGINEIRNVNITKCKRTCFI